jgi:hypothetical protein
LHIVAHELNDLDGTAICGVFEAVSLGKSTWGPGRSCDSSQHSSAFFDATKRQHKASEACKSSAEALSAALQHQNPISPYALNFVVKRAPGAEELEIDLLFLRDFCTGDRSVSLQACEALKHFEAQARRGASVAAQKLTSSSKASTELPSQSCQLSGCSSSLHCSETSSG